MSSSVTGGDHSGCLGNVQRRCHSSRSQARFNTTAEAGPRRCPWLAARRPGCDPCRAAPGDQTAPGSSGDWFSGGRRRQRARCVRRRRAGGRRAPLRAAVPTRGRRSRACASLRLVAWAPVGGAGRHARSAGPRNGVPPPAKTAGTARERRPLVGTRGSAKPAPMTVRRTDVSGAPPAQSGLRARPAARGGADQRSAFPCLCVACAPSGLRCSLRFAQRCRPEVGVPLPARRSAWWHGRRSAAPVGTRGP